MPNFKAFTLKGDGRLNVLKTKCSISEAHDLKTKGPYPKVIEYEAIWDTGATGTAITSKIAKDLNLKPQGFITSHHAGGTSRVPYYLINVYLPQKVNFIGIRAVELTLSGDTEILIGMDIISMGDFSFTNVNGKSCFSFRIPSVKQVDFVQESIGPKKPSWFKTSKRNASKRRKR